MQLLPPTQATSVVFVRSNGEMRCFKRCGTPIIVLHRQFEKTKRKIPPLSFHPFTPHTILDTHGIFVVMRFLGRWRMAHLFLEEQRTEMNSKKTVYVTYIERGTIITKKLQAIVRAKANAFTPAIYEARMLALLSSADPRVYPSQYAQDTLRAANVTLIDLSSRARL